jgi:hypothetical protein
MAAKKKKKRAFGAVNRRKRAATKPGSVKRSRSRSTPPSESISRTAVGKEAEKSNPRAADSSRRGRPRPGANGHVVRVLLACALSMLGVLLIESVLRNDTNLRARVLDLLSNVVTTLLAWAIERPKP